MRTDGCHATAQSALAVAFAAVRELDVIVANHLGEDPAIAAAWARNRRVDYPRGGKQPVTQAESSIVSPTPLPAARPLASTALKRVA